MIFCDCWRCSLKKSLNGSSNPPKTYPGASAFSARSSGYSSSVPRRCDSTSGAWERIKANIFVWRIWFHENWVLSLETPKFLGFNYLTNKMHGGAKKVEDTGLDQESVQQQDLRGRYGYRRSFVLQEPLILYHCICHIPALWSVSCNSEQWGIDMHWWQRLTGWLCSGSTGDLRPQLVSFAHSTCWCWQYWEVGRCWKQRPRSILHGYFNPLVFWY